MLSKFSFLRVSLRQKTSDPVIVVINMQFSHINPARFCNIPFRTLFTDFHWNLTRVCIFSIKLQCSISALISSEEGNDQIKRCGRHPRIWHQNSYWNVQWLPPGCWTKSSQFLQSKKNVKTCWEVGTLFTRYPKTKEHHQLPVAKSQKRCCANCSIGSDKPSPLWSEHACRNQKVSTWLGILWIGINRRRLL